MPRPSVTPTASPTSKRTATNTAEVQMAVEALAASGVKVVFTPTDKHHYDR